MPPRPISRSLPAPPSKVLAASSRPVLRVSSPISSSEPSAKRRLAVLNCDSVSVVSKVTKSLPRRKVRDDPDTVTSRSEALPTSKLRMSVRVRKANDEPLTCENRNVAMQRYPLELGMDRSLAYVALSQFILGLHISSRAGIGLTEALAGYRSVRSFQISGNSTTSSILRR